MTDREKFESLCNLTTNLVGLQKGSLSDKTRKQSIHIPRMVASVIARINKIHSTIIADIIKRDRTSVIHYVKSHKHNYASFPKYRDVFNTVYNSYRELVNSKKAFKTIEELRMFLVKSGIKITIKKPQVYIKIKSNSVVYKIKTNYLNCSENINIIKESLKDYNYTLEIKTI
tara:strand:+ start:240 stop:755 length:516 start_codon:yes stop_codon:yes gene_type:complete